MNQAQVVLVVDDDVGVRSATSPALKMSGFTVGTASDGREALQCVSSGQVAAVVNDVLMPSQDGIEVIRGIRAAFPFLPVVVVSGGP
jgi:DNA-binding NtrC family response regulator